MIKENGSVHFVITGGTIDSKYDGIKDTVVPSQTSVIPQVIDSLKLYSESTFEVVCMKDSRELDLDDLANVAKAINSSDAKRFIITHGTYTMSDTARYLEKHLENGKDKTIIFTGAMIPIEGFVMSDGPFNLGYAYAQVQTLEPGIYVCMNGRTFLPEEVTKIISQGRFSSIFNQ